MLKAIIIIIKSYYALSKIENCSTYIIVKSIQSCFWEILISSNFHAMNNLLTPIFCKRRSEGDLIKNKLKKKMIEEVRVSLDFNFDSTCLCRNSTLSP